VEPEEQSRSAGDREALRSRAMTSASPSRWSKYRLVVLGTRGLAGAVDAALFDL